MTEEGVSSVLGTVLMLSLMCMLIPTALMLKGAIGDEMQAQTESAQHAAFCARNPGIGPPACPVPGPMPGYACTPIGGGAWVCTPTNATGNATGNVTNVTVPTL